MVKYILECWNPTKRRYIVFGEYSEESRAVIMFNKPYFQNQTRRLISIETKTLAKETKKR